MDLKAFPELKASNRCVSAYTHVSEETHIGARARPACMLQKSKWHAGRMPALQCKDCTA
jgi:hypothetical protein